MKQNVQKKQSIHIVRTQSNDDNIQPEAGSEFVMTPYVQELANRALTYLEAGYAVHFSGPAGIGKTTLAFHVAAQLGRPVSLIHGDDEFGSSDLIGRESGVRRHRLVDNYLHNVLKTEEEVNSTWSDNRLTTACQKGETLIYDEFTRSRPEANNALLSILSEKILNIPKMRNAGQGYMTVHESFRAIFTSNPEEYAGTHKTQDALMDRMITIKLGHYDRETEINIVIAKTGVALADAVNIVDVVRELRNVGMNKHRPTIRACIAIGRVLAIRGGHATATDPVFQWVTRDVLSVEMAKVTRDGEPLMAQTLGDVIHKICTSNVRKARSKAKIEEHKTEEPVVEVTPVAIATQRAVKCEAVQATISTCDAVQIEDTRVRILNVEASANRKVVEETR
ncbi:MAG: gas vesicle protein GvpN [Gallionella sp.]